MKINTRRTKIATLAVVTVLALASPALAAPPYQVDVGSNTSGNFLLTGGSNVDPVSFVINGIPFTCTTSAVSGAAHAGPSSTGFDLVTISGSTWSSCTGLGMHMSVAPVAAAGSWKFNATGAATSTGSDNVAGNVSNVAVRFSAPFGACQFSVSGTAGSTFKEGSSQLEFPTGVVSDSLVVSSVVTGCLGLVAPGSSVDLIGKYNVTTAAGSINIKP